MKQKKCPHHNLVIPFGKTFCPKCVDDLDKVSDKLNAFFLGIVIDFGKNGEPVVRRK